MLKSIRILLAITAYYDYEISQMDVKTTFLNGNLLEDVYVDPTRSTGRRDSLLKWKENVKRKCGLIFEFWKIRPKGGTVLLWSRHLLLSLFLNGENQVRTKNPNNSSMEKKRSAKTKFLGPGIRLPIRKVLHMR